MASYAGIGSRRTPSGILELMESVAAWMADEGYVLRTGGAPGADQAFSKGVEAAGGLQEIYLPWPTFERGSFDPDAIKLAEPTPEAMELAAQYHPGWAYLKPGVKKLIARNSHQILGPALNDPVGVVVCWTPNGSLTGHEPGSGGTGQALRIALNYGANVWNLARPDHRRWWDKRLSS